MKIKTLRIHYDPEADTYEYKMFDRWGKWHRTVKYPIRIENLPKVKYFGFCPIETCDVTLEFEDGISPNMIVRND